MTDFRDIMGLRVRAHTRSIQMTNTQKARQTMEQLVSGQEKALAWIYGSVENVRARGKAIVGCTNYSQNPELAAVAPTTGTFEVEGFSILRRKVDQVDNFYVTRL